MSQQILQTSAHFRANLGVLEETAAQVFSNWAEANCIHHVMQEENGSTVLYATRQISRTERQHKKTLQALAQVPTVHTVGLEPATTHCRCARLTH